MIQSNDWVDDLPMINRCVLMLEPTAAFAEWINACDPGGHPITLAELTDRELTVYLVPEVNAEKDAIAWLKRHCSEVLENELFSWYEDENLWPEDISYKTLTRFFRVRFHSMVIDMGDEPLSTDD